jgi:alpha-ketoglutarate-dependent taurine dioxygenase
MSVATAQQSAGTSSAASVSTAGVKPFEVVPLTKHIGAEIRGIDLRDKPDDATVKAIYQAWLDHLFVIFPNQKPSQEDLIRATG